MPVRRAAYLVQSCSAVTPSEAPSAPALRAAPGTAPSACFASTSTPAWKPLHICHHGHEYPISD